MIVAAEKLCEALKLAKALVPRQVSQEIWRYAWLTAEGEEAELRYTNFEVWFTMSLPVEVQQKPSEDMVVPIEPLIKIAQLADQLSIEQKQESLAVESTSGARYELMAPQALEYPTFEDYDGSFVTGPTARDFLKGLTRVKFCTRQDAIRRLDFVCIDLTERTTAFRATDGYRLAEHLIEDADFEFKRKRWLLPASSFAFLTQSCKLFPNDRVSFGLDNDDAIYLDIGPLSCRMLEVEARFPKVSPPGDEALINCRKNAAQLKSALRQVAPCVDDDAHILEIIFEDGTSAFRAEDRSIGMAQLVLGHDGHFKTKKIYVGWHLLNEILNAFDDDDEVEITIWGEAEPLQIRSGKTSYLMMPIVRNESPWHRRRSSS